MKTLKDITYYSYLHNRCDEALMLKPTIDINQIKEEAIKWIKELEKSTSNYPHGLKIFVDGENYEFIEGDKYENEEDTIEPVIKFIKYFFNLTEKDLK